MMGGESEDPNVFSEEIFNFQASLLLNFGVGFCLEILQLC